MGGFSSKVEEKEVTPTKMAFHRRLHTDPRSPTEDIVRTPIMVEKTPEGLLDPRSPTAGILRTPIVGAPVGQTEDLDSKLFEGQPLCRNLEAQIKQEAEEDVPETEPETEVPAPIQELQSLSVTDTDTSVLLSHDKSKVENKKKSKHVRISSTPKTSQTQAKTMFQSKKYNHLDFDVPRSPLSTRNIDTNSPRVIVQRRQVKKVDNARKCSVDCRTIASDDKENVHL